MGRPRSARLDCLIYALLVVATLAVYWQVIGFDFTNYDDEDYVVNNPMVRDGVTLRGVGWAFTSLHASNWHPVTWLSHMLDCTLFGMNPAGHHAVSVLIHLANTLLLFAILRRLTGFAWRSGFVAALFAIHPLHVESVAWVAERKDVLSTFFLMLTILLYIGYARRPNLMRYLGVVLAFAFGLMAKPMLVTLPIILLLLDFWPLRRTRADEASDEQRRLSFASLLLEKLPLLALAMGSCILTCFAQRGWGAMGSLTNLPISIRLDNALVSYVQYVFKTFWPVNLAVFYPHPGSGIPVWQIPAAGLSLLGVTVLALRVSNSRPWLIVGWLWFLVTLVPVIGLVQVGAQSMADRYTYIPLIGLFISIGWGIAELTERLTVLGRAIAAAAALAMAALMVTSWFQVSHWRDSTTLFSHALACTTDNEVAHNNLGTALDKVGKHDQAATHFREALRMDPNNPNAHVNLGAYLAAKGRVEEASAHFTDSLKANPNQKQAHYNMGKILAAQGKTKEAEGHLLKALEIDPNLAEAQIGLGNVLSSRGKHEQAIPHYAAALKLKPESAVAHYNLAKAYAATGDNDQASDHYLAAIRSNPKHFDAHFRLALLFEEQGRVSEAVDHYRGALRTNPDRVDAANNLAWILSTNPDPGLRNPDEAVLTAEKMCCATKYGQPMLLDTLAAAYAAAGRFGDALETARKAQIIAERAKQTELAKEIRDRSDLYRAGRPLIVR